jgi:hypothetical protein
MTNAGVLLESVRLGPSSKGKRLVFKNNAVRSIDGPFAESKERLGCFAVLELSGMDEAIDICRTHTEILGGALEAHIRLVDSIE